MGSERKDIGSFIKSSCQGIAYILVRICVDLLLSSFARMKYWNIFKVTHMFNVFSECFIEHIMTLFPFFLIYIFSFNILVIFSINKCQIRWFLSFGWYIWIVYFDIFLISKFILKKSWHITAFLEFYCLGIEFICMWMMIILLKL